jgi:hypothetical protein
MSEGWLSSIVHWLADLYVVSAVLLAFVLLLCTRLDQPARRMTIAHTSLVGLAVLASLTAIPGWPRWTWRSTGQSAIGNAAFPVTGAAGRFTGVGSRTLKREAGRLETLSTPHASATHGVSSLPVDRKPSTRSSHREFFWDFASGIVGSSLRSWRLLLLAVFSSGLAVAALWLLVGAVRAACVYRQAQEATPRLQELLRSVLLEDERAPRLLVSDQIALPVAIGFLRPTILFPEWFVASEPDDLLKTALAHESAHIRNGDLQMLAMCRILLPIFHAQPLFWLLRRQIRFDQETLADAAAASADRTRYAEVLLHWATAATARSFGPDATALGLWERPSQLRRRIALLLDERFAIEQRSPRHWRLFAWCIGGALVLGLSVGTLRSVAPAVHVEPIHGITEPVKGDGESIVFQGRVLDTDGTPFAGAKVFLHYFKDTMAQKPLEPKAITGPDGRFRFTVLKAHFDRAAAEPWNDTPILAVADGFGLGVSDSDEPDANRDVTVRLTRDDVPIHGRVLDLEGRPVAGARIRIQHVATSARGDLTPFLAAARESKLRIYELRSKYLSREFYFTDSFHPIPAAASNTDGRFVVRGIGGSAK